MIPDPADQYIPVIDEMPEIFKFRGLPIYITELLQVFSTLLIAFRQE